jgi:hypothetical protein
MNVILAGARYLLIRKKVGCPSHISGVSLKMN